MNNSLWQEKKDKLLVQDFQAIAKIISWIEREAEGYIDFLQSLNPQPNAHIVGITGPPGAGKSTLVNALIESLAAKKFSVAVLCIDPSSPFNFGAILGDRIRMNQWHNHPKVYIRSLASRGSFGGLHPKVIEITEVLKAAAFDYILVETVGVGQSEVEIAGLADTTVVVVVPEAGDEIQTMKAGLMEIADIFVVNKADRPDADAFIRHLNLMLAPSFSTHAKEIPIIKTVASKNIGIEDLVKHLQNYHDNFEIAERKYWLLAEKAFQIIQSHRMKNIDKQLLMQKFKTSQKNLYQIVADFISE